MTAEIATSMANAEYHARPEISSSGVKDFMHSPLTYWNKHLNPAYAKAGDSDALRLGTLFHTYLLEPELFADSVFSLGDSEFNDFRTKAGCDWRDANIAAGKLLLTPDDFDALKAMRRAVRCHRAAAALLDAPGAVENSVFATEPDSGVRCRVRPDYWLQTDRIVLDVKTAHDASPDNFAKQIANFRYDVSAAMYLDLCSMTDHPAEQFVWLVVEKPKQAGEIPHVMLYEAPNEMIEHGRLEYRHQLRQIAQMRDKYGTGTPWPGYAQGLNDAHYPAWFRRQQGIV